MGLLTKHDEYQYGFRGLDKVLKLRSMTISNVLSVIKALTRHGM